MVATVYLMSSLYVDNVIVASPAGSSLAEIISSLNLQAIRVVDLVVTGTVTLPGGGAPVDTSSPQTLSNKSLIDANCPFVHITDNSVKVFFNASGVAGTRATIGLNQTVNRTYNVPDSGADCNFVMTEGAQTVNGAKTFSNFLANNIAVAEIDELVAGAGTRLGTNFTRYPSPNGSTVGATSTVLGTFPTATNTVYLYNTNVVCGDPTGDTAVFKSSIRSVNLAGVVTLSASFENWSVIDPGIAAAAISWAVSGTNVQLIATGAAGQTITWRANVTETRTAF